MHVIILAWLFVMLMYAVSFWPDVPAMLSRMLLAGVLPVWLLLRLVRFVRSPATDQARPGSPSGHTDPGGDRKKTGGNH